MLFRSRALGLDAAEAQGSIRFAVGRFTTAAEVDFAVAAVAAALARLGRKSSDEA